MTPEDNLFPEDVTVIERWVTMLQPMLERFPLLSEVDLIVEGGSGVGVTMPHLAHRLFPQATFVGTDLSQFYALSHNSTRHEGQVTDATFQRLLSANANWQRFMIEAVIHADCFDFQLIRDLAAKLGASNPMLVSFDAIGHLRDRRDSRGHNRSVADWFNDSPYVAQLHLVSYGVNFNDRSTPLDKTFTLIEEKASERGYVNQRFPTGILVAKKEI